MQNNLNSVMVILVAVIVIAFFLPWVTVESGQVGAISKLLTGKKQSTIDRISGFLYFFKEIIYYWFHVNKI